MKLDVEGIQTKELSRMIGIRYVMGASKGLISYRESMVKLKVFLTYLIIFILLKNNWQTLGLLFENNPTVEI